MRLERAAAALTALVLATVPTTAEADVVLDEGFDDGALPARGWYDSTGVEIVRDGCSSGSCLRYHYARGDVLPSGRGALRIEFPATEVVYLRYMTRYSDDWTFRPSYGPHELYFLTTADDRWIGPAETHLTVYVEHVEGVGRISAQDTLNVDQSRIGDDLVRSTEARGVHGCNGAPDTHGAGDCYRAGSRYRNGRGLGRTSSAMFSATRGPHFQGDWHEVIVEIRLNTVGAGVTNADGVVRYYFDGAMVFEAADVVFRTSANRGMAFQQFMIGPYFHDGAPHAQDWFVDELMIATEARDVGLGAATPTDAGVPPGSDAGPGPSGSDAGPVPPANPDAGVPVSMGDSGSSRDAGDAGRPPPSDRDMVGGCAVGGRRAAPPLAAGALAFLLLSLAAMRIRRRQPRHSDPEQRRSPSEGREMAIRTWRPTNRERPLATARPRRTWIWTSTKEMEVRVRIRVGMASSAVASLLGFAACEPVHDPMESITGADVCDALVAACGPTTCDPSFYQHLLDDAADVGCVQPSQRALRCARDAVLEFEMADGGGCLPPSEGAATCVPEGRGLTDCYRAGGARVDHSCVSSTGSRCLEATGLADTQFCERTDLVRADRCPDGAIARCDQPPSATGTDIGWLYYPEAEPTTLFEEICVGSGGRWTRL